jgi:hypothetical protein
LVKLDSTAERGEIKPEAMRRRLSVNARLDVDAKRLDGNRSPIDRDAELHEVVPLTNSMLRGQSRRGVGRPAWTARESGGRWARLGAPVTPGPLVLIDVRNDPIVPCLGESLELRMLQNPANHPREWQRQWQRNSASDSSPQRATSKPSKDGSLIARGSPTSRGVRFDG